MATLPPLDAAPRHATVADLDPRARILITLAAIAAIVLTSRLDLLAILALLALIAARRAGVAAAEIRHRLGHVEGFVVVLLLLLPLTGPAPYALTFGPVTLSEAGLWRALALALKLNAAALVLLALIGGLAPVRLGHALADLGLPDRLVAILLLAVRYVGLLRDETERLLTALKARGFRPTTSRHTITTLGLVLGTILVRALERSERIGEAMRCRGFSGHFVRAATPALGRRDSVSIAGAIVIAALVVLGDRLW